MVRYSFIFKQQSSWALLFFIFAPIESNSIICEHSISTIVFVDDCPRSLKEWTKASGRKRCHNIPQNCTSPDQFQYHCLLDPNNQRLFEICATRRIMTGQFCPKFNIHRFRLENNYGCPCVNGTPSCPYHYRSTDVYKCGYCSLDSHGFTTINIHVLGGNTSKTTKGMHNE
ncbi:uncharacterized protein LOC134228389 [Saccostrea cucullata]|uniref:uncharacterized protein LOC134228389 n=1 Tax=Saccostrea cuccullata TaxID=36930 RepID=UPI002ED16A56